MNKPNNKTIIRAVIYIRVSTEEQARHGYSLQAQKERLVEYCNNNGYKIIETYADEGKSARSKLNSRKELLRLIQDAKEKKFDRIVFWRLDRWFRNIADFYKIQELLDTNKIDWECSDEEYNTTTSNGRLHLNIKLSIAQNESDQTGDRIRFNFANMIQNKRAIQGSHCMPLGYKVAGEEKNKHVVKDETTSEIVIDMFEHFKAYNSIRKTLIYINEKYNMNICYDSMRHYIKNELYTGMYKGIENYCEPYITKEEYLENQKNIKCNVKQNNRKHDYIFSGLLKCYNCGNKLSGFTHRTTKPKYNKAYTNHAYRCNRAFNSKACKNMSPIFEKKLETYLIGNIVEKVNQYIIKEEATEKKRAENNISVDKIKQKLDRLAELYIEGKISKEKYDKDYKIYNTEIEKIKSQQKNTKDLSNLKTLLKKNTLSMYNQLTNELKRSFWNTYIDYIERDEQLNFIVHFK